MGLDILESYEICLDGRWTYIDLAADPVPSQYMQRERWHPAELHRNSAFFAILARGGPYTLDPIACCRGIPEDASPEVRTRWQAVRDDPSITAPSWVTLDELLAFDWEQWLEDVDGYDPPVRCSEVTAPFSQRTLPYLVSRVEDPRHLRMVFWFGW